MRRIVLDGLQVEMDAALADRCQAVMDRIADRMGSTSKAESEAAAHVSYLIAEVLTPVPPDHVVVILLNLLAHAAMELEITPAEVADLVRFQAELTREVHTVTSGLKQTPGEG